MPQDDRPDRVRPLRKDAARNRESLIQAARAVFAVRGFDASMDDIAHHAGLGVGTAYRHFANKYELANAIFDKAVEAFVDSAEDAMATPDPWDALVTVIEQTLEAQTENRAMREILLGVRADESEHHDTMFAPFPPLFDRAKESGAVRWDAEIKDVRILLLMLCTVTESAVEGSPYLWRRYLPTLLSGLRPDGPAMPVVAVSEHALCETRVVETYGDPSAERRDQQPVTDDAQLVQHY
jgi:AcrR family transcriptional regulator